jgi:peptide/nickel transport system substrate-binding protein
MIRYRPVLLAAAAAAVMALAACGGGDDGGNASDTSGESAQNAPAPTRGGQITVLEELGFAGAWPSGLDPATNTNGAANQSYMASIYGQLFKLVEGGKVVGELAESGTLSDDGKTFTIKLRDGVKFSDGSPFDAETVKWNIDRSLASPCTCNPKRNWPPMEKEAVTAPDAKTVELHFKAPYAAVDRSFIAANVNWIASKTAFEKQGERDFKIHPVGAGPFKVVQNSPSSQLVVERNPGYYRNDRPYLDKLTFKSIGSDQAAYQAILAGQADAYEGMSTPALVDQAAKQQNLTVTQMLSTSPYVIQLNTQAPPFDDKKARDAIYYATDTEAIRSGLFKNRYPNSQTFTGPGGLFHKEKVPARSTCSSRSRRRRRCRASGRRPASRRRSSPTTSPGSSRRSAASGRRCCRPREPGTRRPASASRSASRPSRRSPASRTPSWTSSSPRRRARCRTPSARSSTTKPASSSATSPTRRSCSRSRRRISHGRACTGRG